MLQFIFVTKLKMKIGFVLMPEVYFPGNKVRIVGGVVCF